jgi:hypothetical protein
MFIESKIEQNPRASNYVTRKVARVSHSSFSLIFLWRPAQFLSFVPKTLIASYHLRFVPLFNPGCLSNLKSQNLANLGVHIIYISSFILFKLREINYNH